MRATFTFTPIAAYLMAASAPSLTAAPPAPVPVETRAAETEPEADGEKPTAPANT